LIDLEPSADVLKTARGSVSLMVQSALNSALGLIFFVLLARLITKTEMGVYAALISTYGVFVVVGTFGLTGAAARFIPKLTAEGSPGKASSAAMTIVKIGVLSSLAASVVYLVLAPYFSLVFAKSIVYADLFRLASIVVVTQALSSFVDGLMQGVQEFTILAAIRIVGQAARIVVTILLLLVGSGLTAVLIGWSVSSIFISLLPVPFLKRHIGLRGDPFAYRPIVDFSIPVLGSTLIVFISSYADVFVTMIYSLPANVGAYNVAVTASMVLANVIIASVTATLLPAMSRAYGRGGLESVERSFRKASRYVALVYVPAGVGFAALAQPLIWLMAGRSYQESIIPLAIISIFSIALGLSTPVTVGLQSLGRTAVVFKITVIALFAEIIAGLIAVPLFGIVGASLARSVFFVSTLIYGVLAARTFMRVAFDREAVWKSGLAGIVMAIAVSALQILRASLLLLPLYVATGALAYLLTLKALRGLSGADILVIERTLPESLRWTMKPIQRLFG
jgi:O-antigen/teichoic acid export membrane protein